MKYVKSLLLFAAASIAFVSCDKETDAPFVEVTLSEVESETVLLTINADKTGEIGTKTTLSSDTASWAEGDKVSVVYTNTSDVVVKAESSPLAAAAASSSFTVSLTSPKTAVEAHAYYPSNDLAATATTAQLVIADEQTPTGTSFDGGSDILVSSAFTPSGTVSTSFRRLGAVLKINVSNSAINSEKLLNLSVTADSPLAGTVSVRLEDGVATGISSGSNTVTATYAGANQFTVNADGKSVYLIVYPQTLAAGTSLTFSGETENHTFSRTIASLSNAITLRPGHITPISVSLADGDITGAALPFNDDMSWADNGVSDSNADIGSSIYSEANSNGLYKTGTKAYKGKGGLKLGTGSNSGSVTTNGLNLTGAFYIAIESGKYSSDTGTLEVSVDGDNVITDGTIGEFNYVNIPAGTYTKNSSVTIATSNNRCYIYSVTIASGEYVAPPSINVTSDNPMAVDNTNDLYTIEYTINNPTGASISASADVAWIHDFDYSIDGEVSFEVDAQESGAAARSGVITLSYTDALDVKVTVNQAAGAGGTTTKSFTIGSASVVSTSSYAKYEATVDGRGWIITFGGNNKSVGTNSGNRSKCNLSSYSKYAVSPVTTSSVASAFASTTSISNVSKISYTIGGGSNQASTNVYLLYSSDNSEFSQITLTKRTQGAAISSGTEFEFDECSGYFAVLFVATNATGNWRIDDANLTFTYTE